MCLSVGVLDPPAMSAQREKSIEKQYGKLRACARCGRDARGPSKSLDR
jgi:hypothetical protein